MMLNFTNAKDHLVGIKSKMFWSTAHLKPPITRLHSDRWNMVENYIHMKQKPHKSSEKQRFKKKKKKSYPICKTPTFAGFERGHSKQPYK